MFRKQSLVNSHGLTGDRQQHSRQPGSHEESIQQAMEWRMRLECRRWKWRQ